MQKVQKITWFKDSPDAGLPECLCSLCGEMIGEDEIPIRIFDLERNLEARFHQECFDATNLELSPPYAVGAQGGPGGPPFFPGSRMPQYYIPPLGLPFYWRNDVTGELSAAIETYLDHVLDEDKPAPDADQLSLLRDYFVHYIHAPCWSSFEDELAALRTKSRQLDSVGAIRLWIRACMEIGLDPI